jgi:hypothetical protein
MRINMLPAYRKAKERAYQKAYWAAHPGKVAEYSRKYRAKDPAKRRAQIAKTKAARRDRLSAIKLDRGCELCGYRASPVALQFHHLRDKEFGIAGRYMSWEKVEAEISKCSVLCANCHARVTSGELTVAPQ